MNGKQILIALMIVFTVLAAYAVYAAESASQRGEGTAAFIMLVIAGIFVTRSQKLLHR